MPLESYRYYCLDAAGSLHNAKWFKAESDEAAIAFVQQKHPDGQCEIWSGRRLVASIRPAKIRA